VTPHGTSQASSILTFGDIARDPAVIVGTFYRDSKDSSLSVFHIATVRGFHGAFWPEHLLLALSGQFERNRLYPLLEKVDIGLHSASNQRQAHQISLI
jgi:hypothetical protein